MKANILLKEHKHSTMLSVVWFGECGENGGRLSVRSGRNCLLAILFPDDVKVLLCEVFDFDNIFISLSLYLPLKMPLKTWLLPPSEASHSTEDMRICESFATISLISGRLTASSLKHHAAISAICDFFLLGGNKDQSKDSWTHAKSF